MGANDGIVSTASLIVGVAAANADHQAVLIAGMAGLVAGAMSMAAGEYVSVSSQADTENADLNRERGELKDNIEFEKTELATIYEDRGLDRRSGERSRRTIDGKRRSGGARERRIGNIRSRCRETSSSGVCVSRKFCSWSRDADARFGFRSA